MDDLTETRSEHDGMVQAEAVRESQDAPDPADGLDALEYLLYRQGAW